MTIKQKNFLALAIALPVGILIRLLTPHYVMSIWAFLLIVLGLLLANFAVHFYNTTPRPHRKTAFPRYRNIDGVPAVWWDNLNGGEWCGTGLGLASTWDEAAELGREITAAEALELLEKDVLK